MPNIKTLKAYRKVEPPKFKKDYPGKLMRVNELPLTYRLGSCEKGPDELVANGSVLTLRQRYTNQSYGGTDNPASLVLDWHCPLCNHPHERTITEDYLADGRAEFVEEDGIAQGGGSIIYLAAPYSHAKPEVMERRWFEVSRAAAWLMGKKYTVISPVSMGHPIAALSLGDVAPGFEAWKHTCLTLLASAELMLVLMLEGWSESAGIKAEVDVCRHRGIPVWCFRADVSSAGGFSEPVPIHELKDGRITL